MNTTFSDKTFSASLDSTLGPVLKLWVYEIDERFFLSILGSSCLVAHREIKTDSFGKACLKAERYLGKILQQWIDQLNGGNQ